uniref:hypothetical protein n=1 Tax=Gelidibacter sp. TaxID=2018083 RepID=UPI00404B0282
MKKVILIVVIISSIFFGFGYFFMQKSSKLITQNEESIFEIIESNATHSIPSDEEFSHYFKNMDLKQEEHIIINNCLQNILNEKDNTAYTKCEDIILDAVIEEMGNTQFIKAIIGNMISYSTSIKFKQDFYKTVFPSNDDKTKISSSLIFAFINRYRDAEKLKIEFDNNKEYFFENVSKDLYQKLFEKTLNNFLDSYVKINEQDNKEAYYKKIYYEAETKNKHDEFWYITFWKRRELEKNDQVVIEILKEIKNYYAN